MAVVRHRFQRRSQTVGTRVTAGFSRVPLAARLQFTVAVKVQFAKILLVVKEPWEGFVQQGCRKQCPRRLMEGVSKYRSSQPSHQGPDVHPNKGSELFRIDFATHRFVVAQKWYQLDSKFVFFSSRTNRGPKP